MENKLYVALADIELYQQCHVRVVSAPADMKRRLLDLGLIENTPIQPVQKSPIGHFVAYAFRGAVIALRQDVAAHIFVEPCTL